MSRREHGGGRPARDATTANVGPAGQPRAAAGAGLLRAAVVIIAAHGLALLGAGVFLLVRAGGHGATNVKAAVTQGVFALLGAAIFMVLAKGLAPPRPNEYARTPALILEGILLPVSIGLVQSGRPELGLPVLASALVALTGVIRGAREGDRRAPGG